MASAPALRAALATLLLFAAAGGARADTWATSAEGYFNSSTTPLNQSIAAAQATLQGKTLHVALFLIAQSGSFPDNVTYGDGNAFLTGFSASTVLPQLRAGNPDNGTTCGPLGGPGYAVPVTWDQVDGAAVWMAKYMASNGNFTIQFEIVRLPKYVYNTSDTLVRTLYILDVLGYDMATTGFLVTPDRLLWVRALLPHSVIGYQVVTKQPVYETEGVVARAFKWTRPFSPPMWGLIVAGIVGSAFLYYLFESNTGSDDFPLPSEPKLDKFMRALYLSAMSSVLFEGFSPHTHEGRLYTAVKAFVFFVAMSSYIAQYAAILGEKSSPFQPITSIADFSRLNAPVCVRKNAAQVSFVQTNYPQLTIVQIPGLTQAGLLPAIVSGQCIGGVGIDTELQYGLGGPGIFASDGFDPQATFCGLTTVGPKLNFGFFGIPLPKHDTANINALVIEALNVFVGNAINTGAYLNVSTNYFPDVPSREVCQPFYATLEASSASSPVIQIADMAGLYVVQAAGGMLALILYAYRHWKMAWLNQGDKRATRRLHRLGVTSRRLYNASMRGKMVTELGADSCGIETHVPAPLAEEDEEYTSSDDEKTWGERTGMERRLTTLLREVTFKLALIEKTAN